jgi:hypothetical protein
MEMKRIKLLSLLLVAALFVQNAAATMLPYSTYYQGRSYFSGADATGYVDFAVYDTGGPNGDEWTPAGPGFFIPGPPAGRYVYAYQVFSDASSAKSIGFFKIMGIDDHPPNPIPHLLAGISTITMQQDSLNPLIAGVTPTGTDISSFKTQATWEFLGVGDGTLVAGAHSWFLIFSSDKPWTEGRYEVQSPGGVPITQNPEPCTLALLGFGSAILFAKRRNYVKSYKVHSHN